MHPRRLLVPAVTAAAAFVLSTSPASAATVTVFHGTFTDDPPPDVWPAGSVCDFDVTIDELFQGTYTVVVDKDGEFVRAEVHITYNAEASGNGVALHDSGYWTDIDYADSTHLKVGLHDRLTGPDGQVVAMRAGLDITFGSHDNVIESHGLQATLDDATFCAAFTA